MNVVFLGATRGMGRALARKMASRGDQLFLLGRTPASLQETALDLGVRGNKPPPEHAPCDLADPGGFAAALDAAEASLGYIDCIVVTAGIFGTQDELEADIDRAQAVLTINFANTVVFCEHARKRLLANNGGTLCVFSSVAGDRGRKPVALYGSAKAGLSHYLESLDHKHRADGLVTICVKPGFVKTGMTEGLKPAPFAGEPEGVADIVLKGIDAGKPIIYAPPIWGLIMQVIRLLPRFVMRRVGF
ncbi:MAG: decaprenylphospho-beta-D-erythro-pentofuranosid-2-ulose 2-reductase [Myxococcota bacterium]|jgi:decaprenylphospho-beta-D-erythro-pentofuranosid-2-ulose 2-reductase